MQVASGVLNQPPVDNPGAFPISVSTQGRLTTPEEFGNIVVKQTPNAVVRVKDVATVDLAAQDYSTNSYLDRDPAVAIGIFQRPGSNALSTAKAIISTMDELAKRFPPGLKYTIVYNPTQFIQESVDAVETTIGEAIILVVLVVILFLQTWRAAVIPIVAIPVSLIGTFFAMSMFGFSLNNLSLFGLVLAIGIVVDDAIVVVENVERNIEAGLSPHDAAIKSMDEVGAALVAIALVLVSVFIPSAFITGISGQFYRQFALTIAGATIISLTVSLTLSPALCALLLSLKHARAGGSWLGAPIRGFFGIFNRGFAAAHARLWLAFGTDRAHRGADVGRLCRDDRVSASVVFTKAPIGFIPQLDRGYLIIVTQLPPAASLDAHGRSQPARGGHRVEGAGCRARSKHRRFLRRHLHQRAERGRDLRHARSVRRAGKTPRQSAAAIQGQLFQRLSAIQEG